jgi:hypothetical protein
MQLALVMPSVSVNLEQSDVIGAGCWAASCSAVDGRPSRDKFSSLMQLTLVMPRMSENLEQSSAIAVTANAEIPIKDSDKIARLTFMMLS